jgi:hypothetical protein
MHTFPITLFKREYIRKVTGNASISTVRQFLIKSVNILWKESVHGWKKEVY